jgi:hypothetical protein
MIIHQMMINPSLPPRQAAVKYSSINEIGPGLLRRGSTPRRTRA